MGITVPSMKKKELKRSLKTFALELLVYAVLVVAYYLLVLHVMGNWLYDLFKSDRRYYTAVSLGLIIAQGVVLETVTRILLSFIKPRLEE